MRILRRSDFRWTFGSSARMLSGLMIHWALLLGAVDCGAQPPQVDFSIEKYRGEADELRSEWEQYLQNMKSQFEDVREFESLPHEPALMARVWTDFLDAFSADDPFSEDDEELRARARERLTYWQGLVGKDSEPLAAAEEAVADIGAEDPQVCLDRLESAGRPALSGELRLGRVFHDEQIIEPVLIRSDATGPSMRSCSDGQAIEVEVEESAFDYFNGALVARFRDQENEGLKVFREVPNLAFEERGVTELRLRGAGSMLEARRLDVSHVEITTFPHHRAAILVVATEAALREMEIRSWEESWGNELEDSRIEREIVWWEPSSGNGAGAVKVHSAVRSFKELADLLPEDSVPDIDRAANPGIGMDWNRALTPDNLQETLGRNGIALFVVEDIDDIGRAEAMLEVVKSMANETELDVAGLEDRWRKRSRRHRLEEAGSWGRYFPLARLRDLAAIMPERIAGKIRRVYHRSESFEKDYIIVEPEPGSLRVANALFLDQAVAMAKTMDFLGCVLDSASEVSRRRQVLGQGFEWMGVSAQRLGEMDVGSAFRYLFQGFSLPAGLSAGDRNFLGSITRGDAEVAEVVESLRGYVREYLNLASLDSGPSCDIALIPDMVLLGATFAEPLVVVPSLPESVISELKTAEAEVEPEGLGKSCEEALAVRREACVALEDALYARAARHTRKKIEAGHRALDRGDDRLGNCQELKNIRRATRSFQKAKGIFLKAKETANRIEDLLPELRVP